MTGPLARLKEAILYRGSVRIRIADPIPLRSIAAPSSTVEQIVERLRARYEALFAKPMPAVR